MRKQLSQIASLLVQIAILLCFIELGLYFVRMNALDSVPDKQTLTILNWGRPIADHADPSAVIAEIVTALKLTIGHTLWVSIISLIIGVFIGVFTGLSKTMRFIVQAPVDFLRGVPVTLLIAVALVSFSSSSDTLLIVVCSLPCTAICIFFIHSGMDDIDTFRKDVYILNYGPVSRWKLWTDYLLPSLYPSITTASRAIASYSLVVCCAIEMLNLGRPNSAGRLLSMARDNNGSLSGAPMIIILLLGLFSFLLCRFLEKIEKNSKYKTYRN
ncbi:MAG: hypothetical protein CFE44_13845 [Burkholderiales bacterium PBB4]|nr:MAG: hypothetical protein CFE44_13845 [Burkholderiales bacterium PBB4]